jgi:hypothetical protein
LAAFTFAQKHTFIVGDPLPGDGWCLLLAMIDRGRDCR